MSNKLVAAMESIKQIAGNARRDTLRDVAEIADVMADQYDVQAMEVTADIAVLECRASEDAMRKFARMLEGMAEEEQP